MGANVSFHDQLTEEEFTKYSKLKNKDHKSQSIQNPTKLEPTTCGATFGRRKKYRKTRNTLRGVLNPGVKEDVGDVLKENNAPSPERPAHGSGDINWDKQKSKKVFKNNKNTVKDSNYLNNLVPNSNPSIYQYLGKCSYTYNTMSSARKDFPNDVYIKTAFKEPTKPKHLSNVTYMDTAHLRNVSKAETKRVSLPFIQRQRLSKENASKQKGSLVIEGVKYEKKKSHHQLLKELLKKDDLSDAELVPALRKNIDLTKEDKGKSSSRDLKEKIVVRDKGIKRDSSGSRGKESDGNEKNVGRSKVGLSISKWEMNSKSSTEMKDDKKEKRSSLKQMHSSNNMKNVCFEEKNNKIRQSPSSKSNGGRKQYSESFVLNTSPDLMRATVFQDSPMLRNRISLSSRSGNEEVFSSHDGVDISPSRRLSNSNDLVNIVPPQEASKNSDVAIVIPSRRSSSKSSRRISDDRRQSNISDERRQSNTSDDRRQSNTSDDRRQSNNDYDITIENLPPRIPRDSIAIQRNSPNNSDDILIDVTGPQRSSDVFDPEPSSQEGIDVITLKPLRKASSGNDDWKIPKPPPMLLVEDNSNVYEDDGAEFGPDAVSSEHFVDDLCSKSVRSKNKMFEGMVGPRQRRKSGRACFNNSSNNNMLGNGETSFSKAIKKQFKNMNVCQKENSHSHSPTVFTPWDRGMMCNPDEVAGIAGRCRESTDVIQGTCYEEPARDSRSCRPLLCSKDCGPLGRFRNKGKDYSKLDPERVTHFENAFRRTMRYRAVEGSGSGEDSYHYMGGVCSLCGTERRKNQCRSACCDAQLDPLDVKRRRGRAAKSVCTLCGSDRVRLCSPECSKSPSCGQPGHGCLATRRVGSPNRPRFQPNKSCVQNCKCPMCVATGDDSSSYSIATSGCVQPYRKVLKMFEEKSSQFQKEQKKDCRRKSPCTRRKEVQQEKCLCSPKRRKSRDCSEQRRKLYGIEREIRDDQVVRVKEYYEEPKCPTKQCYKQPVCSNKQMKRKSCNDFCEPIHESDECECPQYRRCDEDEEEEEPQWEKKESTESIEEEENESKEDLGCGTQFYDENGSYLEGMKCGESVVKLRQVYEGPKRKVKQNCCEEQETRDGRKMCRLIDNDLTWCEKRKCPTIKPPPREESCYRRPPCEEVRKVSPSRGETCKPCRSVDKVRRARTPRGEGCKPCRSVEKVCRIPKPRKDSCECVEEFRKVSPCREKSSKPCRSFVNVRRVSKPREENCECDEESPSREETCCRPREKVTEVLVTRKKSCKPPPLPPREDFTDNDEYENAGPGWKLSDQSDTRSVMLPPRTKRRVSPSEASYRSHYAMGSCRPLRGILKNRRPRSGKENARGCGGGERCSSDDRY